MASGEVVVNVLEVWPPASLYAALVPRAGASTPAEAQNVWAFDGATTWYLDFLCVLQGYGGGGLTFTLPWTAASATTGTVIWGIGIHRLQAGTTDVDVSFTYDYNASSADTAPATNGTLFNSTITFTNGADMNSWANGELAIVRVRRDIADSMVGNSELWGIVGKET